MRVGEALDVVDRGDKGGSGYGPDAGDGAQALDALIVSGHDEDGLVNGDGVQTSALSYPGLPRTEIFTSVDTFYRRFYFRPGKDLRPRLRDGPRPRNGPASSPGRPRLSPIPAPAPTGERHLTTSPR